MQTLSRILVPAILLAVPSDIAAEKYAHGANIGWINFGWATPGDPDRPFLDVVTGEASGYVWGVNVGWISLNDLFVPGIAPTISLNSTTVAVSAGNDISLVVTTSPLEPLLFQWFFNGVPLEGASGTMLRLRSAQRFHSGDYSVLITRADTSTLAVGAYTVDIAPAEPSGARLANLSTRAVSLTGDNVLIPGFVLEGAATRRLLMRVIGPTLGSFGVDGVLANPRLTLKRLDEPVLANDDWGSNANAAEIAGATATLGAFELDPASADAVLLAELEPGPYTIVADGADAITGVVLVELYDADHLSPGSENSPQADEPSPGGLVNLSARAFVGAGAELPIPGFVVSEEGPLTLLIRAAGPALAGFGVAGTLPDPQLTIFGGEIALFGNDDWGTGPYAADTAAIAAQVGAFELPAGSKNAAMVVTLAPGAYTVVFSDVTGATGVALVEVYLVQ